MDSTVRDIRNTEVGDYLWLWISDLDTAGLLANKQSAVVNYSHMIPSYRVDELLVRCYAKTGNKLLFRFYLTDRMDVMKQTILNYDTDFFSIELLSDDDYSVVFREKKMILHSVFAIGSDVLRFVQRYIIAKV